MILYTVKSGEYYNISNFKTDLSDLKEKGFTNKIYINITNKCPCACTFCLRNTKVIQEDNNLWLQEEPTAEEVISEFERYQWGQMEELIFCGFGEPTMRLDAVIKIAQYCKKTHPSIPIRINTNGLGNLIYGETIAPKLKDLIDTISISLNASNKEKYYELTRSKFGIESFDAMLEFAVECKNYIPNVVLSVVDCIGEKEINICQKICDERGLTLRVRPLE